MTYRLLTWTELWKNESDKQEHANLHHTYWRSTTAATTPNHRIHKKYKTEDAKENISANMHVYGIPRHKQNCNGVGRQSTRLGTNVQHLR